VRQLIAEQHRQGQSGRSLARLLSSLRGLYRYLNQEGRCAHDPAAGISAPKGERRLPRLARHRPGHAAARWRRIEDDFIGHRDQAMLELFYSSGLRLAELVGLNLDQLDLPDGTGSGSWQGQQGAGAARGPQSARSPRGVAASCVR
jgi:integrase/recombinase XerC